MKKQQILTLIIGILIGAIITATVFLIVKPGNSKKVPDFKEFNKDGEKFNPSDENFDSSNFKPGEGRNRRSKDNTDNSKEDNKVTEDKQDEKQG